MADMADLFPLFRTRTVIKLPPRIPLGLCYVAAAVRDAGYRVRVIDNYLDALPNGRVADEIIALSPRVAGFSVTVVNKANALGIAADVKRRDPRLKTVFGGPHATIMPLDLISDPAVDYVVVGEGEQSMPLLLGAIMRGDPVDAIPGLYYKAPDGTPRSTGPCVWIRDLDGLPLPARDLVDFDRYHIRGETIAAERVATISSSRGCPYRCAFCASEFYFSKKYRCRSAASVIGEIERLIADYRIDGLYFREDCFTVNRARVVEICGEMVRRKIALPWECEARVDTLDPELLRMMYEAGCRGMWCGIESGSPRILDYLQKGITLEQVRNAYRWAHEAGIAIGAGFMVGLPGETMDDAFQSLRLAKELRPCWAYFQSYVGYPRSRIYDEVARDKLFVRNVGGIFDVQTRELRRSEIRALEEYFQKEFVHWQKSGGAGTGAEEVPRGGWPRISVIVPARNAEGSIEECLVSLVNLDYPKDRLEIRVVDNGSSDRTREIASRFPVTVLVQDRARSSYASRNAGLRRAAGEIIAFTDSDCVATQDWLKKLVQGCDDAEIGCFAGEVVPSRAETFIDEYLHSIGFMSQRQLLDYRPLPRAMTANLAFRREVFDRVGMFDDEAISGGDSEILIRMLTMTKWRVDYRGNAVVYHRHRTRPWPFFTQFVRYGWGEARLRCAYREQFAPCVGAGVRQSGSDIVSGMKTLLRGRGASGGMPDMRDAKRTGLDLIRHFAWHLGLQGGIVHGLYLRRGNRGRGRRNTHA
jgi:radical SAM superfamily enzyme YgiQ (UPF0313 family)/GT2 family glycosyltransferase